MRINQSLPSPNEVHVWAAKTDPFAAAESIPEFLALLSADEQRKAARFRTPELTERYVVSHALLRHAVSWYVGVAPADVRIALGRYDRPLLPDHPETDFNLSHTDGMAVVAVTRGVVGVDIERLRDDVDVRAVSRRVCSDNERATIPAGSPPGRTPFFDYWTLKEAYAKAIGLGVRVPFRDIDISLGEPMKVDLRSVDDDAGRWTFELYGSERFRLAVVARRQSGVATEIRLIEADSGLQPVGALAMRRLQSTRPTSAAQREKN